MKKIVVVIIALLALMAPTAFAQATVDKDSSGKQDLTGWILWSSCGDNVLIQKGHMEFKSRTVQNGENYHVSFQAQFAGQGIGLATDENYVFSQTSNESFSGRSSGFTYSVTGKFRLNRRGKDGDMFVKFESHITVNANGAVTASFSNFRIECE